MKVKINIQEKIEESKTKILDNLTQISNENTSSNSYFNPTYIINSNLKSNIKTNYPCITKQFILMSLLNQEKSIHLQSVIRQASNEIIEYIVNELKGYYRQIINDKNGNYFMSDVIKVCEPKQRIIILEELSPIISVDCINNFSTHPIQVLIERSSSEIEYKYILYSFNDYNKFLVASLNPNGAFTIQKIVERIPNRYRKEFNFIFASFIGFTSKTKFGVITVKKFISCTKSENIILQIMNFVRNNFMNLAVDQYANYLIQFLFEEWRNTSEGNEIKELIFNNFKNMHDKKYSSFICESFIENITFEEKMNLIKSLDLNYILKSNNKHSLKIMKALGIFNSVNNNFDFPLTLNNTFENISMDNINKTHKYINFPNNKKNQY